jgi:cell wall-associated NlpC family hydrolase
LRLTRLFAQGCALFAVAAVPSTAIAAGGSGLTGSGGAASKSSSSKSSKKVAPATNGGAGMSGPTEAPSTPEHPTVPGNTAKIIKGVAYAPSYAPMAVKKAIWAGNQIRLKPYAVGGGHGRFKDDAYDCSGAVSYVLHAAGLLKTSEDSGEMESWGQRGAGDWITVYTNPGHAFVEIAGIRFDTSAEQDPNPPSGSGPRWRPLMTSTDGFMARHPAAY